MGLPQDLCNGCSLITVDFLFEWTHHAIDDAHFTLLHWFKAFQCVFVKNIFSAREFSCCLSSFVSRTQISKLITCKRRGCQFGNPAGVSSPQTTRKVLAASPLTAFAYLFFQVFHNLPEFGLALGVLFTTSCPTVTCPASELNTVLYGTDFTVFSAVQATGAILFFA